MNHHQCEICGKKDILTFHCNYCGGYFCAEHRLPERHNCAKLLKKAQWFAKPSKPTLHAVPSATAYSFSKSRFTLHSLKKTVFALLKFVGFSVFTLITGLPLVMYLYLITVPEFASSLGLIYLFKGNGFLWYIVIPNLGYVVMWFFTVYKILRGRAEWWYHLVLLIFGLWSWWGLFRVILVQTILGGIFG